MTGFDPVINDKERVRRLVALPGIKPDRIRALRQATVAIVGVGGLGQASAQYLAAQGVGHIRLIDPDEVALHNLSRQVLLTPADVGRLKVEAVRDALVRQAPTVTVDMHPVALASDNLASLLDGADLILDGLDQGVPRDELNRYAVETGRPVLFAGAIGYEAQVFGVAGGQPCLACLFGSVAESVADCAVTGVLGPVVALAGLVQAQEALKWLLGIGRPLFGRLWQWDGFSLTTRILDIPPRPDCPVCGKGDRYGL